MVNIPFKSFLWFAQNRFLKTSSAASISPSSSPSSFAVQRLLKSRGFSSEIALATSQELQFDESSSQKRESVVTFLESYGFSESQISKVIQKRPRILQSRVDEILKPKIQYLIDNGFVGSLLPELVSSNPDILARGLCSQIKPSFEFLKTFLGTNEKVVAAVKRGKWLLTFDREGRMQPNIDYLISEGVPIASISRMIILQPRAVMQKFDRVAYAVKTVKKLGVEPTAGMFIHAVRVMVSMSDSTWKRKVELFKSLGWTEEEVMSTFKRHASCFSCSEEKIKSAMDFFVNTMKLELAFIIAHPMLLSFALDKRIRPRYTILKLLESKKLFKWDKKLASVFAQPEKIFLKKYVSKHLDQVPHLMKLYHSTIMANK